MNLYEISKKMMACIDAETGEIEVERFEALEIERNSKIENIGLWIKNLKAEAEALKNEKMAFAERQKAAENKAESLKKYLGDVLGGEKFKTEKVAISFRKSKAVEVEDEALIPEKYVEIQRKVSKKALMDDLKKDVEIDGCHLVENNSIQIK